jgi:hypothetical protein
MLKQMRCQLVPDVVPVFVRNAQLVHITKLTINHCAKNVIMKLVMKMIRFLDHFSNPSKLKWEFLLRHL